MNIQLLPPFSKTKTIKAINHVKEYHWEIELNWTISVYSGTAVDEKKVINSRACKTTLITQSKANPIGEVVHPELNRNSVFPIDLSMSWLLQQIDMDELATQFKVDLDDDATKTPRRNEEARKAIDFGAMLSEWCMNIGSRFNTLLHNLSQAHNPALPDPGVTQLKQKFDEVLKKRTEIINPILPLMEENGPSDMGADDHAVEGKPIIKMKCSDGNNEESARVMLSTTDITKLLNEHARSLDGAVKGINDSLPPDSCHGYLSSSEAVLILLVNNLRSLSAQYLETMDYVESMMESQLVAAIGKRLTPADLDKFVKFHNARLVSPAPQPFSHSIRRPEHYPGQ